MPEILTETLNLAVKSKVGWELASRSGYSPAWFAVFTAPRHEKKVAANFVNRQIQSFLPLYSETRRWRNRRKVELELPLFPCYIFTHIDHRERVKVLNVPGVIDVIGCSHKLLPVPDDCIESLRNGLALGVIKPHPAVSIGDRVRIIDGPMIGFQGVMVRVKNDYRVVIRLESILQSIAVEVRMDEVEPLR